MKNTRIYVGLIMLFFPFIVGGQNLTLTSPSDELHLKVEVANNLNFRLIQNNDTLVKNGKIGLNVAGKKILGADKIIDTQVKNVDHTIYPDVSVKNQEIRDVYRELTLYFDKDYKVEFRLYDDALAYRFVTEFDTNSIIEDEVFDVFFTEDLKGWFPLLETEDNVNKRWMNTYEHLYTKTTISELRERRSELPLLLKSKSGKNILITESDLRDYPGLYLTNKNGEHSLTSIFPPRVKSELKIPKGEPNWERIVEPASVYPYIANTRGDRSFPWRIIAIGKNDKSLLNNEIVYKLAREPGKGTFDWVKPGQVAWDWWNNWNLTDVDFKAGINNKTYKYYIDFAEKNNIPYIIMDDGWYVLGDLTKESDDIDVAELVEYGRQKGVKVILWASWLTLREQMEEAFILFEKWGIKGLKIDFMDRDDQDMVNYYWDVAEKAAKYHLMVDFHGSHKPAGLNRTFPNVVNYEGVAGLENNKWTDDLATPEMAVTLPFIRMFAGPMDYTPGAMRNAQFKDFQPIYDSPMSMGTRAQQVAMYILYDAPLQMLSDSPTNYEKNQTTLDYLVTIPSTWEETIPLSGKVGEYVTMARKKGEDYFVAAMTNDDKRTLKIDFSFLPEGKWGIKIFKDGINADRNGEDYKIESKTITNGDIIEADIAPAGGWSGHIQRL